MKPGTLCASAREGVESDKWNPLGTLQRSERGIRTMELKGEMCLTGSDFTEATSRRKTLLWVQVSRRADCQVCVWGARLFAFWPTGKQRSQACVRNRIDSPQGPPCNGTCCLGSRSQGFHNPPNMVNSWGPVVQTHEPVGVVWDLKLLQQGNRLGWYRFRNVALGETSGDLRVFAVARAWKEPLANGVQRHTYAQGTQVCPKSVVRHMWLSPERETN